MEATAREGPQDQESALVTYLNRQGDWLGKTRGNLVVAATVIATMSFQIMVNPPGGVWQNDNCPSKDGTDICKGKAGTSVLEHDLSKRNSYLCIVITSVMSFSASMSLILLVISGLRLRNRLIMGIMVLFMVVAVICISAAFYFAMALVHYEDPVIENIQTQYLVFWFVFPVLVLLVHIVQFLRWCICGCLQSHV